MACKIAKASGYDVSSAVENMKKSIIP